MKKVLQKSLRRLHTLLLLAVMFVVGGSAWAANFNATPSPSNFTVGDINGDYTFTITGAGGEALTFQNTTLQLLKDGNVVAGSSVTVKSVSGDVVTVTVSGVNDAEDGEYTISIPGNSFLYTLYGFLPYYTYSFSLPITLTSEGGGDQGGGDQGGEDEGFSVTFNASDIGNTLDGISVVSSSRDVMMRWLLLTYNQTITISSDQSITITKVEITGDDVEFSANKGSMNGTTWTGSTNEGLVLTHMSRSNTAYIQSIKVYYEPSEVHTYHIVFDNPEGAEGVGVKYANHTYTENADIETPANLVDNDFKVQSVDHFIASGSLEGTTYTATYTRKYTYTMAINNPNGRINYGEVKYANGESFDTETPASGFKAEDVQYYDNDGVAETGDGKLRTLTVTYTPFEDVNFVVNGLPTENQATFWFRICGNSFGYGANTVKVSPKQKAANGGIANLVANATVQSYPGLKYIKAYDNETNTISVTYSEIEEGVNYDFASSVPNNGALSDEPVSIIRLNLPNTHTFSMPSNSGSKTLSVKRGDEDAKNITANYSINVGDNYIEFNLHSDIAYCGAMTVTIPEGTVNATYGVGNDMKKSTNNEYTINYNTKYSYQVLNAAGTKLSNGGKVSVNGNEVAVYTSIKVVTPLTLSDVEAIDVEYDGNNYEGEITTITAPTNENMGSGQILVKYSKVYNYAAFDDPATDHDGTNNALDAVTIYFKEANIVRFNEVDGSIKFNNEDINVARIDDSDIVGYTKKLYITFNEVTETGNYELVIPKGYYRINADAAHPILNEELRFSYEVVAYEYKDIDPISKSASGFAGDVLTFDSNVEQFINIPTFKNPSNGNIGTSLEIVDGKLQVNFAAQTANGDYTLTFPKRIIKFADGEWNNEFTVTYTITTPALNVSAAGWTSFCLDVPFKLAKGYTPWYVSGTEANGVTLSLVEVPVATRAEDNVTLNVKDGFPAESGEYLTINVENDEFTTGASLNGTGEVTFSTEGTDAYIVAIDMRDNAGSQTINDTPAAKFEGKTQNVVMNLTASELQNVYVTLDVPGDVIIPAGEGILIEGDQGSVNYTKLPGATKTSEINDNMLVGKLAPETVENDEENLYYKFNLNANGDLDSVGFYWEVEGGHSIHMNANKAYIIRPVSAGSNYRFLINGFEDDATSIDAVVNVADDAPIFNLQGKRVARESLTSGVYVQNGRKFIVK